MDVNFTKQKKDINQTYFPHIYRGWVEDCYDPLKLGRLKVRTTLHQNTPLQDLPWAWPAAALYPPLPSLHDQVWVVFENGQMEYPVWFPMVQKGVLAPMTIYVECGRQIRVTPFIWTNFCTLFVTQIIIGYTLSDSDDFTIGENVVSSSGGIGTVVSVGNGTIQVKVLSGDFVVGDTLTGSSSGVVATIDSKTIFAPHVSIQACTMFWDDSCSVETITGDGCWWVYATIQSADLGDPNQAATISIFISQTKPSESPVTVSSGDGIFLITQKFTFILGKICVEDFGACFRYHIIPYRAGSIETATIRIETPSSPQY